MLEREREGADCRLRDRLRLGPLLRDRLTRGEERWVEGAERREPELTEAPPPRRSLDAPGEAEGTRDRLRGTFPGEPMEPLGDEEPEDLGALALGALALGALALGTREEVRGVKVRDREDDLSREEEVAEERDLHPDEVPSRVIGLARSKVRERPVLGADETLGVAAVLGVEARGVEPLLLPLPKRDQPPRVEVFADEKPRLRGAVAWRLREPRAEGDRTTVEPADAPVDTTPRRVRAGPGRGTAAVVADVLVPDRMPPLVVPEFSVGTPPPARAPARARGEVRPIPLEDPAAGPLAAVRRPFASLKLRTDWLIRSRC